MMRRSLVAAVAAAPLLAVLCGAAHAATVINTATTTPVATSTAGASNAPADIDIQAAGSVSPTSNAKPAVTIDSSNSVSNEGTISFSKVDNATGVLIQGGNTGTAGVLLKNTATISITDGYTATDTNKDGVVDGVFSTQTGGYGVRVVAGPGGAVATGDIINSGALTLQGNGAVGVSIETTLNGSYLGVLVTPASGTTAATAANGSIVMTGNNVIGVSVANTGHVNGNLEVGAVQATGAGAQGVSLLGGVDGAVVFNGAISVTGYRDTAPSSVAAATLATFTADELQQGGSAIVIGANVGKGVMIAAAPAVADTTHPDADANGIPDASQTGTVTVFGSAPAIQVGASGKQVTIGQLAAGDTAYGFVNEGTVTASGLYAQATTPNLPGPVSATAIQIGVTGDATGHSVISGGFHNTSTAAVGAAALNADSTAIRVTTGGSVANVTNDGTIAATSTVNFTTDPGARPQAQAILIDQGGSMVSLTNTKSILATVSGTIASTVAGNIGAAYAIHDQSGTLLNVANSGAITAVAAQTVSGTTPTTGAVVTSPTAVAIDLSAGTAAETITQTQAPDITTTTTSGTTTTTTTVAATAPSITGDIRFGAGDDKLNIHAGTVTGALSFGAGSNTLTIDGATTVPTGGTTIPVTTVTGAITDTGGTLTVNLNRGLLSVSNADTIAATSVNVGATSTLLISADPLHNKNTDFVTTGASTIAAGATFGLTLASLQTNLTQSYTIIEGGQGKISASTFGAGQLANAPFLFAATTTYQQGATPADSDKIILTVSRKTAQSLGFNAAESAAYNEVFNALLQDAGIQKAVLAQTTKSGLISVYDQMLPDQGQGVFDTLDQATQSIAGLTAQQPDAGTRVAGSSLWLQEVNERVKRGSGETLGSQSQMFGLVGGYERMGAGGGALGVTFSYMNIQDRDSASAVGEHTVASLLEAGGYYRRALGGFRFSARGAGGYAFFHEDRQLVYTGVQRRALSNWGAFFADAHVGGAYEWHVGRFYARPEISADYLYLRENGHTETGGGDGFDLNIASRASHRLSGEAILTLGTQFGRDTWLRPEIRGGYRRIFSGNLGDTTARFTSSSTPFTLDGAPDKGGWFTVGFSLKGGTNLSYLALEGDADFRDGEQRYDLYLAGRSMF